jgi:hypothetical protein
MVQAAGRQAAAAAIELLHTKSFWSIVLKTTLLPAAQKEKFSIFFALYFIACHHPTGGFMGGCRRASEGLFL